MPMAKRPFRNRQDVVLSGLRLCPRLPLPRRPHRHTMARYRTGLGRMDIPSKKFRRRLDGTDYRVKRLRKKPQNIRTPRPTRTDKQIPQARNRRNVTPKSRRSRRKHRKPRRFGHMEKHRTNEHPQRIKPIPTKRMHSSMVNIPGHRNATPPTRCHPDRSGGISCSTPSPVSSRPKRSAVEGSRVLRPPLCHPDRSEAQWMDLVFYALQIHFIIECPVFSAEQSEVPIHRD